MNSRARRNLLYMSSPTREPTPHVAKLSFSSNRSTYAKIASVAQGLVRRIDEGPHDPALLSLVEALVRRSVDVDAATLSDALRETLHETSTLSSEPLSSSERTFLLENTDLDEEDLTDEARETTRARVLAAQSRATASARERTFSTDEVAQLTGRNPASIRRSVRKGDLYVLNPGDPTGLRFPQWQFVENRSLPGLAQILDALPGTPHPLSVEAFMSSPREELGGRSAIQWLADDGPVETVVHLADDEGRM